MNERKLHIFCEVAENLNMTRVAEKLYISQPSISQSISELEEELKTKLFDRIGRKLYLTYEGDVFYKYVRRILNLYKESFDALQNIKTNKNGRIKLGVSHTIGAYIIPKLIAKFNKDNPNLEICLIERNTKEICELLLKNDIDFALIEGDFNSPEIVKKTVYEDELVLIYGKNHAWNNKCTITKNHIKKEKFIIREPGSGTRQVIENFFAMHNIEYHVHMELSSNESIKNIVRNNLGIAYISKNSIEHELRTDTINMCTIEELCFKRPIYLLIHKDKHVNSYMNKFLDLLQTDL